MDSLSDLIALTKKDTGFINFLEEFREYVSGSFDASDLISVKFLLNGEISGCSSSGKYLTNGFLFTLLKLHLSTTSIKSKVGVSGGDFIGTDINCNSFLGLKRKTDKTPKFRANLTFVSAVLNFILTHSPLDWSVMDFGDFISADSNCKFLNTIRKIYSSIEKVVLNRRYSGEEKVSFLKENFDPSSYFTGYSPIVKKAVVDVRLDSCESQNSEYEVKIPSIAEPLVVPASVDVELNLVEQSKVSPELNGSCHESIPLVKLGSKRKRSEGPSSQRALRVNVPNNRNKIHIWRSTYKYKISQIDQLKSQVRGLKDELSKRNNTLIENAVSAATEALVMKVKTLEETLNYYDEELSRKDLKIKKLNEKYKSLKDDYDAEAFQHHEEISKLEDELESKDSVEILETFQNAFDVKNIPLIKMRDGPKKINENVFKVLSLLKLAVGLSLRKCVMTLVLVGNKMFGQKWSLPKSKEYKTNARLNRCMPAPQETNSELETLDSNDGKSGRYKNIDDFTAPAPSWVKKQIETIIEPNAQRSIFEELKDSNTQYATIGADHFVEHRQKHQTQSLMTSKLDPETGKSTVAYRCLGLNDVFKTTSDATFEHIKRIFQLGAILTAKSDDAEDILTSLKEILKKVKFSVTDGASNMKGAIDNFSAWRSEMTGITNDFIWIHCNAHVLPALTGALEKCLKQVEKMLDLKMYVCQDFNKMFFKVSESVVVTIFNAIFRNVGPSSKNHEYACTTQFHAYLKSIGEPLNRFFDPQSARFGKVTEMGMIIAYNFKILKNFFEIAFMPNNLFKACELYMTCPGLYEICIAMTCSYYHLLGPFKIACGADKLEGYKNRRLPHNKLLKFYKQFEKTLRELYVDPSPMLKIAVLPRMAEFNLTLLTKGHYGIVSFVVEELNTNAEINIDVVKGVLKMLCEEYLTAVVRQASEFYIKEGSVIEQALQADEHALDNVPTTSLCNERSVGQYRQSYKVAPNASTRTHSNNQMIPSTPFFSEFANMTAEEIREVIHNTKTSDLLGILTRFNNLGCQIEQAALQGTVTELVKKRDDQAKSRAKLCQAVKGHGGPLESPDEVDQFVQNFKGTRKELAEAIDLQLKFRKVVINDRTVNSDLYKCREKDAAAGGKYRIFSVEERTENLKKIVAPIPEELSFPQNIDTAKFNQQIVEYQSSRSAFPHHVTEAVSSEADLSSKSGQPTTSLPPSSEEPVKIPDSIEYVAAFYDGEQQPWYPGIVTKYVDSKLCESCKAVTGIGGMISKCLMAKFMEPIGLDVYKISDDQEYHVHPSQLLTIPIVEYVQLENDELGYKILNYLDIDTSVSNNQLFKCLHGDQSPKSVEKSKRRGKGSRKSRKR